MSTPTTNTTPGQRLWEIIRRHKSLTYTWAECHEAFKAQCEEDARGLLAFHRETIKSRIEHCCLHKRCPEHGSAVLGDIELVKNIASQSISQYENLALDAISPLSPPETEEENMRKVYAAACTEYGLTESTDGWELWKRIHGGPTIKQSTESPA